MNQLGFSRPHGARGFIPLALGALAIGKAIYGAVGANQQKQRNKGYINDAYRSGVQRLETQHGDIRQSSAESMNARGLLTSGASPIHTAMAGAAPAATDLASGVAAQNEHAFGMERHDLDAQHERDLNENKAGALNAQIGAISGGIEGVMGAYSIGQDMASSARMSAASRPTTPITSALLSGSAYGGIHPTNPLGDPSSSWHLPKTINGVGQSNADFNIGEG